MRPLVSDSIYTKKEKNGPTKSFLQISPSTVLLFVHVPFGCTHPPTSPFLLKQSLYPKVSAGRDLIKPMMYICALVPKEICGYITRLAWHFNLDPLPSMPAHYSRVLRPVPFLVA